ncbi:hypothetical protein GCM10023094_48800 [Rhodococcus olei]|uniref:Uncharacterized protein n=1 Tax=Rhodococcus olei TaxID=2161675 RepID=A0ABP8PLN8_9NOCA
MTGTSGVIGPVTAATTVASVGPYALNRLRPGRVHCRTSSGGQVSPPVTTETRAGRSSGSTDASAAGVTNAWVTRSRRSSAVSSVPPYICGGATTIVAPDPTASSSSRIDASKLGDEKCSVRDRAVTPKRTRSSSARFASPRWVTTTPFGTPVDPDV